MSGEFMVSDKQVKSDMINDSIKVSQINKANFPKQEAPKLIQNRTPRSCLKNQAKKVNENSFDDASSQENQTAFTNNKQKVDTNARKKKNEEVFLELFIFQIKFYAYKM